MKIKREKSILSRCGWKGCERCYWFEVVLNRGQDWCQKYDRQVQTFGKGTRVPCKGFRLAEWIKKGFIP